MREQFTESARAAARLDFGRLRIISPLRLACGVVIPLLIGIGLGQTGLGVSAAIGSFIVGVADTGDTLPVRMRVMAFASAGLTLVSLVGGLVSPSLLLVIAVSALLSFVCGYLPAIGVHAGTLGVLALVMYCVFAGVPVSAQRAWAQGAAVLLGCLLQTGVALAPWPLRRCSGIRGEVADAWRTLAVAANGDGSGMVSPAVPAALVTAASGISLSGVHGVTHHWLAGLVEDAEAVRLPLTSISARRRAIQDDPARRRSYQALTDFSEAVSAVARGISGALVVQPRKRSLPRLMADLEQRAITAAVFAPGQVDEITVALRSAVRVLSGAYPIGRHAEMAAPVISHDNWGPQLKANWSLSSPLMRHALRLAVLSPVAWALGDLVLDHHQYWVPLTVAWVARPEYGFTVGRVAARVAGTLAGLGLVGAVIYGTRPDDLWLTVICFIAAFTLYAALPVNYAFAVIFITALIVALLEIDGDPLVDSIVDRGAATIMGGILVVIASRVAPLYAAPGVSKHLAALCATARAYGGAVLLDSRVPLAPLSRAMLESRLAAAASIEAAKVEPRGSGLDPATAEQILDAELATVFALVSVQTSQSRTEDDMAIVPGPESEPKHRRDRRDRSTAADPAPDVAVNAESDDQVLPSRAAELQGDEPDRRAMEADSLRLLRSEISPEALSHDLQALEFRLLRRAGDTSVPVMELLTSPDPWSDPARAPLARAWQMLSAEPKHGN